MEEKDGQQVTECLHSAERAFRRVHSALPEYTEAVFQVRPSDSLSPFSAASLMTVADRSRL